MIIDLLLEENPAIRKEINAFFLVRYIIGNIQISKGQSLPLCNLILKPLLFICNSSMLKEPKTDPLALMDCEGIFITNNNKEIQIINGFHFTL